MPKKRNAPVVEQTSSVQLTDSIEAIVGSAVEQAQQQQSYVHQALSKVADAQVRALEPYVNGQVLNTMVVQRLAGSMASSNVGPVALPELNIIEVFEGSCDEQSERINQHTHKAVALLQGWGANNGDPSSPAYLLAGDDAFAEELPEYGSFPQLAASESTEEGVTTDD